MKNSSKSCNEKKLCNAKKEIICVTGPMASGKNFICSQMEKNGFISLDLDKEVHKVLAEKTQSIFLAFEQIAKEKNILIRNSDNTLNRKALGLLLFSFPDLLQKHESIIYPALEKSVLDFIKEKQNDNSIKAIILNATVLYKTPKLLNECSYIIYVQSNCIKRFFRAKKRDKMPMIQILQRFKIQKNLLANYKKTDKMIFIVKN